MNFTHQDTLKVYLIKNFIAVFLTVIINFINGSFVYIYFRSQDFQRDPRYVLFIHLVLNDMILLSISVLLQIFTYILKLPFFPCCVLILILVTSNRNNTVNLACMAVERYIAVCWPLHHPQVCTVGRTYVLIAFIWSASFLPGLVDLIILLLAPPGTGHRHMAFSLVTSCYAGHIFTMPQHQTNKLTTQVFFLSVVSLTLVITYLKVLFAASAASRPSDRKARNTILLHGVQLLLSILTYMSPLVYRPIMAAMPNRRSLILFTSFVLTNILPRLISPFIYGVRDQKFSMRLRRLFSCRRCGPAPSERLKSTAGERVRPAGGDRGTAVVGWRSKKKS